MKAKPGFILRNVVGEHILMPTGDNMGVFQASVVFSDVAALVWERLQAPVTREELLSAILDEYQVEEAVAAADLDELLAKLRRYQLIED